MKHTITLLFSIIAINAISQCWIPQCDNPISLSGNVSNTTYTGSKCFLSPNTVSFIKSSSTFKNWDYINFNGLIIVETTINMPPGKKIYTANSVSLNNVTMEGNDTIYAAGSLNFVTLTGSNGGNTILLSAGIPYVMVGSVTYFPGETINGNIKVLQCSSVALPIKLGSFKVVKDDKGDYVVSFQTTDDNTDHFNIWITVNGVRKKIAFKLPEPGKRYYTFSFKQAEIESVFH